LKFWVDPIETIANCFQSNVRTTPTIIYKGILHQGRLNIFFDPADEIVHPEAHCLDFEIYHRRFPNLAQEWTILVQDRKSKLGKRKRASLWKFFKTKCVLGRFFLMLVYDSWTVWYCKWFNASFLYTIYEWFISAR